MNAARLGFVGVSQAVGAIAVDALVVLEGGE
jgi:hypothetical protein